MFHFRYYRTTLIPYFRANRYENREPAAKGDNRGSAPVNRAA